jgi:hypothetical protein
MRFFALTLIALLAAPLAMSADVPRVLVLGDSLYLPLSQQAMKLLQGKAEIVYRNNPEVFTTTTALASIDELLGDGKWDLIHFNYGLGDLIHRAPGMKSFRVMPQAAGGIPATDPAQYAKNLDELAKRLQATGAKLVWASTTPIHGTENGLYKPGSEIEYNAIAAKVMAANRIPVSDMHAAVTEILGDAKLDKSPFSLPRGVSIHPPFVAAICRALSIPVPKEATSPKR